MGACFYCGGGPGRRGCAGPGGLVPEGASGTLAGPGGGGTTRPLPGFFFPKYSQPYQAAPPITARQPRISSHGQPLEKVMDCVGCRVIISLS